MPLLLRGATLIDGRGGDPQARAQVRVDGDRITSVAQDAATGAAADAEILDLDGLTLLPGLIDAHVHLAFCVDLMAWVGGQLPVAEVAAALFRNCSQTLDAGFTSVRDVGGVDGGLVRAIERGSVRGPRVLTAGPIICQHGGHGHFVPPFAAGRDFEALDVLGLLAPPTVADGPDEVRKSARRAFRRGASFLKLCVTGGVVSTTDSLEDTQYTVEELHAAVLEARARHTYVTVHAHNSEGIRNALDAGVECVEHGTFLDEETAARMARDGVALVPTFAVAQAMRESAGAGVSPTIAGRGGGAMDRAVKSLELAVAAGVAIGSGSDLLGPVQDRRGLELVIKSKLLDPMQAIVSATATNARILRVADRLGSVEQGKLADLIAVDGDPLAEPELFDDRDRVVLVIKGGQVVKDSRA